jgi:hypothetical protein
MGRTKVRKGIFESKPEGKSKMESPEWDGWNLQKIIWWELKKEKWKEERKSYITTDGQSASLSWNKAPVWGLRPELYYCQTVAGLLMWGALSDERTGLSFTTAPGPHQGSHFRVRVRGTRDHILLSQIRDFPFCRLLGLAGLRWRYSTPPPQGSNGDEWTSVVKEVQVIRGQQSK